MVRNRIKVMRAEIGISAAALTEKLPDITSKVAMSFVEQGQVLPTKEALAKMCEVFGCSPDELYNPADIDLRAVGQQEAAQTKAAPKYKTVATVRGDTITVTEAESDTASRDRHEGMEQLRVWMQAEEKAALFKAVNGLGYKSVAEWLRDMYRQTILKYVSLGLKGSGKIHEAVPPTTESNDLKLADA